jgi:hypothetical protein
MLRTFIAATAVAGLLFANNLQAQEDTAKKHKTRITLSIDKDNIHFDKDDSTIQAKKKNRDGKRFSTSFALVDLGVNILEDNTNYSNGLVKSYFHNIPASQVNTGLFELRTGKSINVNIYPWMAKYAIVKASKQRIYVSSGLGLQLYNFRYDKPLVHMKDPVTTLIYRGENPSDITLDTIHFKKNKLALNYLNVPLMFTFKTRFDKKHWLVYGVGVTEGFRLASWTKQVSNERGKVKYRDNYGLADFNTCLSAEIGIEGILRFYATYQLTSLYGNSLDQHPICFGLRFSGI